MKTRSTCPSCGKKAVLTEDWTECRCKAEGRADGLGGTEWRKAKIKTPPRETRLGRPRRVPKPRRGLK